MAVSIAISITQNSQSVANNTSNVTVKLVAKWTGGSWNHLGTANGWLQIDGTKYTFTVDKLNASKTTSGSQTLITKTVNVSHNADGTKTLSVSASFYTGIDSQGTKTASASKTLTTIPRKSTLTVANGTLGEALTLKVNSPSSNFNYTIAYNTDGSKVYKNIASQTSSTSVSWTPPLSLASANTTGTSVTLYFSITTIYNGNSVGTSTTTCACTIPASVKPSCSVSVSDPTGYYTQYGSYLRGLSKFKIVVNPTLAYDSPISTYKTTANGATYTAASFTTGTISSSGTLKINATVTDKRKRSGTASTSVSVLNYIEPAVSKLTVKRCNEDGTENDQGEYVQITMGAAVTSISDKNSASYLLRYKKSADTAYTEVGLDEYENVYSLDNATYIFEADTGSSYDVQLEVTDDFKTITRSTVVSTAFTIMHWGDDGTSMAIGKVCEEPNLLDIGLPTRFNKPVSGKVMGLDKLPQIPSDGDLNDYMATGSYAVYRNSEAETIGNMPVARAGRLEVNSATGEGIRESQWSYIRQRFIPYNNTNAVWERDITRNETNVWTYYDWWRSSLTPAASEKVYHEQKILWEGGMYMTAGHTINLSEAVSAQPNGIVLTFSKYADGEVQDNNFNHFFVPKIFVTSMSGYGTAFTMMDINFGQICHKYLYINDTTISGHENNDATGTGTSGITYANNKYVLRYVYGV